MPTIAVVAVVAAVDIAEIAVVAVVETVATIPTIAAQQQHPFCGCGMAGMVGSDGIGDELI